MAQIYGIDRQPTKLDYSSPTQFKFNIIQLPKVEFFTTEVNLPGITLADAIFPTPFTDIPVQGDKLTFDNLIISFIGYINTFFSMALTLTLFNLY